MRRQACQGTANVVSRYICHLGGVQVMSWQRQLLRQLHCDLNPKLNKTASFCLGGYGISETTSIRLFPHCYGVHTHQVGG